MTRQEYMSSPSSHEQFLAYYDQWAVPMEVDCSRFWAHTMPKLPILVELFKEDPHLNNLPRGWLTLMDNWTLMHKSEIAAINFKINGDRSYRLSDGACILKTYIEKRIRKYMEDHNETQD